MKKTTSSKSTISRRPSGKTVEEYLVNVPKNARATFDRLRSTVKATVPSEAEEVISYGIPALKLKKVVVWYAAFEDHVSLFPTPAVIAEFQSELKDYSTSKGTVHFPLDKPLPTPLIKKMLKARVEHA